MRKVIEIRWHGRGGQGVVTASKLLATAALLEGYYIQAFPEYSAERMGAPIQSFNRISREVIDLHCQISEPDVVVVLDRTLLKTVDVTSGLKKGGTIIINTPDDVEGVKKILDPGNNNTFRLFVVDATNISKNTIGKAMPNTPMIGALVKATGIIKLDSLIEAIKKTLLKKVAVSVAEANILAVKKASAEVRGSDA